MTEAETEHETHVVLLVHETRLIGFASWKQRLSEGATWLCNVPFQAAPWPQPFVFDAEELVPFEPGLEEFFEASYVVDDQPRVWN